MELVNFVISAVARNDRWKKLVRVGLTSGLGTIEVTELQDGISAEDYPTEVLRAGTREYQLMEDMTAYVEEWCRRHDPFRDE